MNKKEILEKINRAEKELADLREKLKNFCEVKVGQHYQMRNNIYVVAQVDRWREDSRPYVLIDIKTGVRWDDPVHDINDVFWGMREDFKLLDGIKTQRWIQH